MSGILAIVLVFIGLAAALGGVAYFTYQRKLRRAKAIERGLKMIPIMIHLPPPSSDTAAGSRDMREVMREKTAQAEVLYNLLAGTATEGFKSNFYGQRHIALELIAVDGLVHFFAAVPVALVSVVKKAVLTAYPGARLEEMEDHNIFNQEGRLAATLGGEMVLRAESAYPIATYEKLERDPMEALLTTLTSLDKKDGAAIQLMLRPASPGWTKRATRVAEAKRRGKQAGLAFTPADIAKALVKAPSARVEEERAKMGSGVNAVSNLEQARVTSIEEKIQHPGFEVLIRVIASTSSVARSQQVLRDISTTFALYEAPGLNGFKFLPALDVQGLVTAFIFRFFPPELKSNVLCSSELATLFHLPDSQFTPSASVARQQSKQVDGPAQMPTVGLLFGYNEFRGVRKEIRLSPEDRRRHTYILGQTGTGKSTMLENLAVQDMLSGGGFAFIDPHGDSAEKLLALVPKERAEDVIYFNPGDTQYPLGLNLFEFSDPAQKDFLVQETINMLYKLYDPGHTGIIGPRYEHWYRNAALTLMSDPTGATFIEIPKVFTDTEYLKQKFKYLKDPTVIDFWTKEMGQTSDYHKSEMLGWFVSKFGAFQNNEMMRNIIGQTKSAFDIRQVMDQKKILIVNLSKGQIGELNSQLLGMIFVIKFQAAAMSRANVPEDQRPDFALYVDEFQNFSTDSFASILSEARKYRLNLIVANQFIGQLSTEIRDAVFGNIGTIVAHRMGPDDAEFMVKQFAPVFDASDLVNIPNYNAAMRLMIGGLPSQPFSLHDSAPIGSANAEMGLAIKQLSAAKYGHDKAVVEADILTRFSGQPALSGSPKSDGDVTGVAGAGAAGGVPAGANAPLLPVAPGMSGSSPAPITAASGAVPAPIASVPTAAPAAASASGPAGATAGMPEGQAALNAAEAGVASPPIGAPPVEGVSPAGIGTAVAPVAPGSNPSSGSSSVLNVATTQPNQAVPAQPVVPPMNNPRDVAQSGGIRPEAAPPPIGASPIDLPSAIASPLPPSAAPVDAAAVPPIGASPLEVEAAAQATNTPVVGAPPPIGAPPVDLQEPAPVESMSTLPASSPDTLSLRDITGASSMPPAPHTPPASEDQAPTSASPLDEIPLLGTPAPAGAVSSGPSVGEGQALPSDPYANIDVLGSGVPVSGAANAAGAPGQPVGDGVALPDDPYTGIDVLGESSMPATRSAEPPIHELWPEPNLGAPVVQAPTPTSYQSPMPQVAPAPAPGVAPEPQATMPAALSAPPVNLPEPPPTPPRPLASAPLPAGEDAAWRQQAATADEAWEKGPEPLAATSQFQPQPVPVPASSSPALDLEMSQPAEAKELPASDFDTLGSSGDTAEPLIHFVDPAAESLMSQSDTSPATAQPVSLPTTDATFTPAGSEVPQAQQDLAASLSGVAPDQTVAAPTVAPAPVSLPQVPPAPAAAPLNPAAAPPAAPQVAPPLAPAPASVAPPTPPAPPTQAQSLPERPMVEPTASQPLPTPPVSESTPPAPVDIAFSGSPHDLEEARKRIAAVPPAPTPQPAPLPPEPLPAAPASVEETASVKEPASEQPSAVSMSNESLAQTIQDSTGLEERAATAVRAVDDTKTFDAAEPKHQQAPITAPSTDVPEIVSKQPASPQPPPQQQAPSPVSDTPIIREPEDPQRVTEPVASGAQQIKTVEHQIDDLLSDSLIHSEGSGSHHRLPEPPARKEPGEGYASEPGVEGDSPRHEEGHAVHHGLKVIQPLEPIVPAKERFAKELAELSGELATPAAITPAPKSPAPAQLPKSKPATPVVAEAQPPQPPAPKPPVAPPPAPAAKSIPAVPKPVERLEPVSNASSLPTPAVAEEVELPQAESLAASDVAKARQHEAPPKPAEAPASVPKSSTPAQPVLPKVQPEAKPKPAPAEAAPTIVKHADHMLAEEPPSAATQENESLSASAKRRRRRGGRGQKTGERIESVQEAQHNEPSEAAKETAPLTGTLIMPTSDKPTTSTSAPTQEVKPKKLAPGEVYVDESGNVVIGE